MNARVFFDANVYFSGFYSPKGASSLLLEFAKKGTFTLYSSRLVLREAERNLKNKTDNKTLKSFRRYLQETAIKIVPAPSDEEMRKYEDRIHPKDVPVLAAAYYSKSNYLITLYRAHFFTEKVLSQAKNLKITTPGEFLSILIR